MDEPVQTCPSQSILREPVPAHLKQAAELESALCGRIVAAVEQLQRVECLDEEQRAEIHAILEAMRHDSLSHASLLGCLGQGGADA